MNIKFKNVGRENISFVKKAPCEDINEIEYDWLYCQVAPHCRSREIEFLLNQENMTTGVIIAGWHEIGQFEILRGVDE